MRFPGSTKRLPTPAVPSILTLFPVDQGTVLEKSPVTQRTDSCVGYGLEVVPIERCNTSCGKTVSPDTPEKEVIYGTLKNWNRQSKPLPPLPNASWKALIKRKWYRLPAKKRIAVLLCVNGQTQTPEHTHADFTAQVQLVLLMTVGLSLLSVKPRLAKR
jgi:hypothetical protein